MFDQTPEEGRGPGRAPSINVLGGIPGQLDRSTLGHPGKFTFCVAEDEDDSPWPGLAQERGVPAGTSAVTVMSVESPHQVMNEWTHDPREILDTLPSAGTILEDLTRAEIDGSQYDRELPARQQSTLY